MSGDDNYALMGPRPGAEGTGYFSTHPALAAPQDSTFTVKDSGKRENHAGGMVRDTSEGKVDYTLITDGPMFQRWADHLTKGAVKYEKRNWMKCADGDRAAQEKTLSRFKESAFRHFIMWMNGDRSEDHAAGVFFNLNGYEYLKGVLDASTTVPKP